jgi:glycosyltransferase involved in cell wall biosynthesis
VNPELPQPSTRDVSVVIPCFNDGATVADAVRSVAAQKPGEIVVVNDGSTDGVTLRVLEDIDGRDARVIHQENGGLSRARMRGVAETSGRYVLVLDADDELYPGALSRMVGALDADEELALVWGDIERFGAAGYLLYPKAKCLDPWRVTFVNELVGTTVMRRDALEAVGGWTLEDPFEDWDLWMAMAEAGMRGRHIGGVTLRYRVDSPRMYLTAASRHDELVGILRRRHPGLYSRRAEHRRASATEWPLKVLWTAIDAVPLPGGLRRYLLFGALIVCEPSRRRRRRPPRGRRAPEAA